MSHTTDVIVIGLGAHGSAAVCQLALRGVHVVGIDQFAPRHTFGSSHGASRITRLAIGEGSAYTPFAMRSHEIWRELEALLDHKFELYRPTGGLIIGDTESNRTFHGKKGFVATTIKVAQQFGIAHRILTADRIRKEFPLFRVADDEIGYYENDAGVLFAEQCLSAHWHMAQREGAWLQFGTKVENISTSGREVVVSTSRDEFRAPECIIASGAWVRDFLPDPQKKHFSVTRQLVFWFRPGGDFTKLPVYIWERPGIYGFPESVDGMVKVAIDDRTTETTADTVDRRVSLAEYQEMEARLKDTAPALLGERVKAATCKYTQTPDRDFVIDRHPEMENVLIVSACSGHGFKHSAAIGELAAKLVLDEPHSYDLSAFKLSRFDTVT